MGIKHIDAQEFKEIGFLQEANRLFFHPHGLALELTTVDGDGDSPTRDKIKTVLEQWQEAHDPEELDTDTLAALIADALNPPGSMRFSGCWDCRDDPEGIYYGDWQPDAIEKVKAVWAERARHYSARARMFGHDAEAAPLARWVDRDVEPTTFVEPRDSRPLVEFERDATAQDD